MVSELNIQIRTVAEVFLIVLSDGAFRIKSSKNTTIGIVGKDEGLEVENGDDILHTLSKRLDIQVQAINVRKKVDIEIGLSINQHPITYIMN